MLMILAFSLKEVDVFSWHFPCCVGVQGLVLGICVIATCIV